MASANAPPPETWAYRKAKQPVPLGRPSFTPDALRVKLRRTVIRERRKATRVQLPEAVRATVDGVPVRVLELSPVNARVEHEQRFPLQSPQLRLEWNRSEIHLPFRIMRWQIVSRSESEPLYHSGIEFIALDPTAQGLVASILQWARQSASAVAQRAESSARKSEDAATLEDTWTRGVQRLRSDPDDDLS